MCGISGELLNFEIRKSIAKTQQQSQQVLPLFLASKSCYQTKQTLQNAIPMKTFKNFQGIFFLLLLFNNDSSGDSDESDAV